MQVKHSWILALLLTGCQLTQQTENKESPSKNTETPSELTSNHATRNLNNEVKAVVSPQSQEDLWQRIAMQLTFSIPDDKMVNYYRTWYLKHPGHLKTVSERAQPFLYLITQKIEQRDLPLELALLPIVES